MVSSSYYFQSAGKRCFSTHSWSPFWLFWWQYMQKAKRDEDEPQPTNWEFEPRGSHSDWTIATESQREYMGARSALSRGNTQRLGLLFSLWACRKWALCFLWVTNHSFYILDLLSLTFFPQFNSVSLACLPFAYLAPSSPHSPHQITAYSRSIRIFTISSHDLLIYIPLHWWKRSELRFMVCCLRIMQNFAVSCAFLNVFFIFLLNGREATAV